MWLVPSYKNAQRASGAPGRGKSLCMDGEELSAGGDIKLSLKGFRTSPGSDSHRRVGGRVEQREDILQGEPNT